MTATTVVALLMGGLGAVGASQARPGGDQWPRHSSDDQPGLLAPRTLVDGPFGGGPVVRTEETTREVAPGVQLSQWRQTDPRGPLRVSLLTADLSSPDLQVRYAGARKVAKKAALTRLLAVQSAVAGVNGDFYDISDTAAPLGVGVYDGVVRHGPRTGWTTSFLILRNGRATVRKAPVEARILRRPGIRVTNLNSPQIPIDGVGVYTRAWGKRPGYAVVEGAPHRNLRQVVVRDGRVVKNTRRLTEGQRIRGPVLIGRGAGAEALKKLRRGNRVRLSYSVKGDPRTAISGSERLLARGEVRVDEDLYMHPRTAVGIDRDTGEVLFLVVDGRSEESRGVTLVELAMLLQEAGAEAALNLDGGGSSTMVAADELGVPTVVNTPSDGQERMIPNGLAVTVG
jgi:hypothetical protein